MTIFKSPRKPVKIPEVDLYSFLFSGKVDSNRPFVVDSLTGEAISHADFKKRVDKLAAGFHQYGLKEREVIGIYSPNHIEYGLALVAAVRLGACATTVNPTYTPEELNFQLVDSGARILITIPDLIANARKAIVGTKVERIYVFGKIGVQDVSPLRTLEIDALPPRVEIKDLRERDCFLCYSSGTTGKAKGVELTHHNVVSNILQIVDIESDVLTPNEVYCGVLPLYHIYGLVVSFSVAIYLGFTLVIMAKFDLEQYLNVVQTYKVSIAHVVPPILIAMTKSPISEKYNLRSIKMVFSGAAPLGRELQEEATAKLKCNIKQGYGMTELSPVSHVTPNLPAVNKPGAIGILVSNQEAKIVDPVTGKELGIGEEGELWVRGPNVMKGYLNRPDANAETIDKYGFLHTGDIAMVDSDGYYYITERLKELIKVKGLQVAPAELEALLLSHPVIADCAVIGVPDERTGEIPKAYITLKPRNPPTDKTRKDIIEFIEKKVAPHKRLRDVEFIDAIPKTASGKILRRILRDRAKQQQQVPSKL